jgi:hypothetical protein
MSAEDDEARVDDIREWFHKHGRELLLNDRRDTWFASIPVAGTSSAQSPPIATGGTRREAAENMVTEYLSRPYLGGGKGLTPP